MYHYLDITKVLIPFQAAVRYTSQCTCMDYVRKSCHVVIDIFIFLFVIDERGKLLFVFGNAFGLEENDHYIYKEVKIFS